MGAKFKDEVCSFYTWTKKKFMFFKKCACFMNKVSWCGILKNLYIFKFTEWESVCMSSLWWFTLQMAATARTGAGLKTGTWSSSWISRMGGRGFGADLCCFSSVRQQRAASETEHWGLQPVPWRSAGVSWTCDTTTLARGCEMFYSWQSSGYGAFQILPLRIGDVQPVCFCSPGVSTTCKLCVTRPLLMGYL